MTEKQATESATRSARAGGPARALRAPSRTTNSNSGFLMALIVGALALVLAFTAITIALGRAPQPAAARPHTKAQPSSEAPATTYAAPTPTSEQLPAQPIQNPGVNIPVYEPPAPKPKAKPSAKPKPAEEEEAEEVEEEEVEEEEEE